MLIWRNSNNNNNNNNNKVHYRNYCLKCNKLETFETGTESFRQQQWNTFAGYKKIADLLNC